MDRHDLMKDVKKAKREARIKAKQGLFTGMHTEFFPFAYAFKPLLEKDPKVKAMYDEIKATDSYVTKTILMKGIEWMAKYPLFRLLDPDIGERLFAAEFQLGFSGKEKEAFQKRLDRAVKVLAGLVDDAGMHNVNQRIFIIPDETEDERLKWARKAGVLIEKGKGLFYSGTKGRFASNIDGQFNMHGIADYVSNKGERCTFEKQFYKVWIRKLVMENDKRGALEYLVERCRQLAIGEVSKYEAGWGLLEYQVDKALKIAERKLAKLKDGHKDKGKSPLEYFVETANNIPEPLFGELEHQIVRTLKLAETELIERGSEEEKALGTLGYLIARAEDLTKSEKSENPLQYERTAARDHNAFSGVSAVRHKAFMAKQRIRKGEIVRYEYSLDEMQAKFFGVMSQEVKLQCKKYDLYLDAEDVYDKELVAYNKKQKAGLGMTLFPEPKPKAPERVEKPLIASMKQGTISEIVRWAFNFKQGSEGRDILDRIYVGDGTQEDVNALLNLIGEENVVSINRYIRPGTA